MNITNNGYDDLTPKEQRIYDYLMEHHGSVRAAITPDMANEFGISPSRVRGYVSSINATVADREFVAEDGRYTVVMLDGNEVEPAETGTGGARTQPNPDPKPTPGLIPSAAKAAVTKEAKDWAHEMENFMRAALRDTDPQDAISDLEPYNAGEQDILILASDDHIGEYVEDEQGNVVHNTEIALECIRERSLKAAEYAEELAGSVGTVHLCLNGDTVTGTAIHQNQWAEIDRTLMEQLETAIEVYWEEINLLAEMFPNVHVPCQPGNHGKIKANGIEDGFNVDSIAYMALEFLVRVSDLDNVTFTRNNAQYYTNFQVRGHRVHMRHGQNSLEHIGTSSGKNRWRGWLHQFMFDLAIRGHFHEDALDRVLGIPVFECGSITPPSDFEDSISEWSQPTGKIIGVSDENAYEWERPIYYDQRSHGSQQV